MNAPILTSPIFIFSNILLPLFHSINSDSLLPKKPHLPPDPLYPSVSPLNARVFDGNPFMDLMDFSGAFFQDLGDAFFFFS